MDESIGVNLKIPKHYFKSNVQQLQWAGVPMYQIKNPVGNFFYSIYAFIMMSIFIYYYTFTELMYAFENITKIDKVLFTLSYAVIHVTGCAKITVLILRRKSILKFLHGVEEGRCKPDINRGGIEEIELIKRAVSVTKFQIILWAVIIIIMLSNRFAFIVMHPTEEFVSEENPNITLIVKQFPYTTSYVIPFNMQKSPYFELVYIHQMVSIWLFALVIGNADAIINGIMIHLSTQFKIIANTFENITERAQLLTEKNNGQKQPKHLTKLKVFDRNIVEIDDIQRYKGIFAENLEKCLIECIKHHQDVLTLSEDVEATFNLMLLSQFLSSLYLYCFLMYQLSMFSMSLKNALFVGMCLFLIAMVFQVYVFCWNGNQLSTASEAVAEAAYNSQWVPAEKNIRILLLMVIARAQRPVYITAGKFSKLSMATFATILRGSVSYFMVLRNVNDAEE